VVERRPINDLKPDQEMTNHIRPYKKWYVSGFVLCFCKSYGLADSGRFVLSPPISNGAELNKRQIPERNLTID